MIHFLKDLPPHEKRITLSTLFTLLRIVLAPCMVIAFIKGYWTTACVLFVVAAASDSIDGALARWRGEQTQLGALLDPLADKFLLLSSFFTLAFVESPFFSIPRWFLCLVVMREIILISGVIFCYSRTKRWRINPTILGKMNTAVQVMFILWLFLCHFFHWLPVRTYCVMLTLVACIELISLIQYVIIGLRWFGSKESDL